MKWLATKTLVDYDVPVTYDRWLRANGIEPVFLGPTDEQPESFGEYRALLLSDIIPARDVVEEKLIRTFLTMGRPVFGICRGIQILNVVMGGQLIQHVPDWLKKHGKKEVHSPETGDALHPVKFMLRTSVGKALRGVKQVNSHHHQAADPARLGKGLRLAAQSPAGIPEAVVEGEGATAPIIAVQWHPERMDEGRAPASQALMKLMLSLV
ncbi:MAG: gamma-glutamyl-gamma-aminobutyrate hydrolase family protein [Kiritimatiellaeota bacterium]|nr:gamma-glutamyl-gamma-aminobutyrate hydrolase family protein [Kiritimatiellota bacterium]